jgi:hypothetical protein
MTRPAHALGRAGGQTSTSSEPSANTGDATIFVTTAGTPPVSARQFEVRRSGLFHVDPTIGAKSLYCK